MKRRFDTFELVVVAAAAALVAAVAFTAFWTALPTRWLEKKYGPKLYSEHHEELIVRDFFNDRRGGFFVDIGAAHYKDFSNTYYLEHRLGWSGIAVDPLQMYAADYAKHRPRTKFVPLFVSDTSGGYGTLYIPKNNPWITSASEAFVRRRDEPVRTESVPAITLDDLLDRERVGQMDFLSIDVELSEPKVLAGFSVKRFRPSLVCIEAHPEVRQAILGYFTRNKYVVVGRYLRTDDHNLYFTPLSEDK